MSFDDLLYNLHFDVEKVRQADHPVDWNDAPLPSKLYQGVQAIKLPQAVGASLVDLRGDLMRSEKGRHVPLSVIGEVLRYTYGITQFVQAVSPWMDSDPTEAGQEPTIVFTPMLRRFVPSGGALYPSEVYVYLNLNSLSSGVYYYDAARHRLVLLREGIYDNYLQTAVAVNEDITQACGVIFVSTYYWKNFFKYREFGYRLEAIDAGIVVGQLQEVTKELGFRTDSCFQFLDDAVNHLLGLSEQEETVYAVVPLFSTRTPASKRRQRIGAGDTALNVSETPVQAQELCNRLPSIHHSHTINKSHRVDAYQRLVQLNRAARRTSTAEFTSRVEGVMRDYKVVAKSSSNVLGDRQCVSDGAAGLSEELLPVTQSVTKLPLETQLDYDLKVACENRYSPGMDFSFHRLTVTQLAALLQNTAVANQVPGLTPVVLAVCVHGIHGVPDGAYIYDSEKHALRCTSAGDYRLLLQSGMSMHNVSLVQVPLCIHVLGLRHHYRHQFGYRGYRMQQMQVGMVLQRLLLTASALGMNGHPLLDYDESLADEIYHLEDTEHTCLIQVPVGFYQSRYRFELPVYTGL